VVEFITNYSIWQFFENNTTIVLKKDFESKIPLDSTVVANAAIKCVLMLDYTITTNVLAHMFSNVVMMLIVVQRRWTVGGHTFKSYYIVCNSKPLTGTCKVVTSTPNTNYMEL
jgi:hypothetical protein